MEKKIKELNLNLFVYSCVVNLCACLYIGTCISVKYLLPVLLIHFSLQDGKIVGICFGLLFAVSAVTISVSQLVKIISICYQYVLSITPLHWFHQFNITLFPL